MTNNTGNNWTPDNPTAQLIHDYIANLRAETRLYPDLYANQLAEQISTFQAADNKEDKR